MYTVTYCVLIGILVYFNIILSVYSLAIVMLSFIAFRIVMVKNKLAETKDGVWGARIGGVVGGILASGAGPLATAAGKLGGSKLGSIFDDKSEERNEIVSQGVVCIILCVLVTFLHYKYFLH